MTEVIVKGAGGRMGSRILSLVLKNKNFRLAGALEGKDYPLLGKDAGESVGMEKTGVALSGMFPSQLKPGTVCVDFTSPESTLSSLEWAEKNRVPLVIGTTGFSDDQLKRLSRTAEKLPVVYSPNMSIGVNVMFKIIGEAASKLGQDYDIEILELHHRLKKDAPSGTALQMARILASALEEELENVAVYHREGLTGGRKKKEIGIQAVRAGDIIGEHTVYFAGTGERLEITHKATSRDNFAQGALMAAAWVVDKPPGLYDMQAVLGL